MGTVVAIGGGDLSKGETLAIDREIIRLTGKDNPKALFIPTASCDAPGYCETFHKKYGLEGGCESDVLLLVEKPDSEEEIRRKIEWADLIYVGGGDTREMLRLWRKHRVDSLLREAFERGTILAGLSAGSICWFEYGHSDSEGNVDNDSEWSFIQLEALGFVPGIHCPHYNEEGWKESFLEMLKRSGLPGLAIQNNCAVILKDGFYRVVSSQEGAHAFFARWNDKEVMEQKLAEFAVYLPYPPQSTFPASPE